MSVPVKNTIYFLVVMGLIASTGFTDSWNVALGIFNMGLISAIMALGLNLQWGYAGLFNIGVMGFVALGGLAAVIIGMDPVDEAWAAGGPQIILGLLIGAATVVAAILAWANLPKGLVRSLAIIVILIVGAVIYRTVLDPARAAVEAVNPAGTGYLGGLGLPVILSWPVGGLLAAGAAWIVGKTALGLRADYLAIATLGIAEIIISLLKFEDWLSRGVKNVVGIPRPVPYEIDLQADPSFVERATSYGLDPVIASALWVKILYAGLFLGILLLLLWLAQSALNSPWGRMMRAIRDNEVAAEAMGKNVTGRHLEIFILGSAICGMAGAMMVTLEGQLTPASYQPLRFTFLIWVMVIVGGSGNNFGSILGGFLIWFLWVMVEPYGLWFIEVITANMAEGSLIRERLVESAAHMRLLTMGLVLLIVLRFRPRGLIPER